MPRKERIYLATVSKRLAELAGELDAILTGLLVLTYHGKPVPDNLHTWAVRRLADIRQDIASAIGVDVSKLSGPDDHLDRLLKRLQSDQERQHGRS